MKKMIVTITGTTSNGLGKDNVEQWTILDQAIDLLTAQRTRIFQAKQEGFSFQFSGEFTVVTEGEEVVMADVWKKKMEEIQQPEGAPLTRPMTF
jgi:hypothetical protein